MPECNDAMQCAGLAWLPCQPFLWPPSLLPPFGCGTIPFYLGTEGGQRSPAHSFTFFLLFIPTFALVSRFGLSPPESLRPTIGCCLATTADMIAALITYDTLSRAVISRTECDV